MISADVHREVDDLLPVIQELGANAASIQHPPRRVLVMPREFQDVALLMDPVWGLGPQSTLLVQLQDSAARVSDDDPNGLVGMTIKCNDWIAEVQLHLRLYYDWLLDHADEEWPQHALGLNLVSIVLDRLGWIGWACSTIARRLTRAAAAGDFAGAGER